MAFMVLVDCVKQALLFGHAFGAKENLSLVRRLSFASFVRMK